MFSRYKFFIYIFVSVLLMFLVSACSRSAESKQPPIENTVVLQSDPIKETDPDHSEAEHNGHDHPEEEHSEHEGEETHDDHDHSSNAEEDEDDFIEFSPEEAKALGITTKKVQSGAIKVVIQLQGEIRLNADRTAKIVPRLSGIVSEVHRTLGDKVARGDVLAVIESRELAESRAIFHGAVKRLDLAKIVNDREQRLWKKKISSEQEYLDAKKTLAEARIELQVAKEKLIALGISRKHLETLPHGPNEPLARYELVAPFDGTIVKKEISLGEVLGDDTVVFVVSDLSTVWADLSVYQKDLSQVKKGQKVLISAGPDSSEIEGTISYVGPLVEDDTRRALARVVLPNINGSVTPGVFVTARVLEKNNDRQFIVAKSALQNIEGNDCVFIKKEEGFKIQYVVIGETDEEYAEVLSGLSGRDKYVDKGAFELKAKIITGGMDSHAGHGH